VPVFFIKIYKLLLSPFFLPACRFEPSCSCYAEEAYIKYGIFKGTFLAVKRVLRCNPFGGKGYDPVE